MHHSVAEINKAGGFIQIPISVDVELETHPDALGSGGGEGMVDAS